MFCYEQMMNCVLNYVIGCKIAKGVKKNINVITLECGQQNCPQWSNPNKEGIKKCHISVNQNTFCHVCIFMYLFIQAALAICGLGICGFDYSLVRKQGNSKGIFMNLSLQQWFWYSRIQFSQQRNPREQRLARETCISKIEYVLKTDSLIFPGRLEVLFFRLRKKQLKF